MSMVCEKHHVLSFKTKIKFEIIPFDPDIDRHQSTMITPFLRSS